MILDHLEAPRGGGHVRLELRRLELVHLLREEDVEEPEVVDCRAERDQDRHDREDREPAAPLVQLVQLLHEKPCSRSNRGVSGTFR